MLVRQQRQDRSVGRSTLAEWDGAWEQVAIAPGSRTPSARTATRRLLEARKLAEFRDGLWLRPANLDARRAPELESLVGAPTADLEPFVSRPAHPNVLAARLWDLPAWSDQALALIDELDRPFDIAVGFARSASVLRHFLADPELPSELLPTGWPGETLRARYASFDQQYRMELTGFFRSHGGWSGSGPAAMATERG